MNAAIRIGGSVFEDLRNMSVHGEYGRALEALLTLVRQSDDDAAETWIRSLEDARVARHADLSSAATACLASLERIDAKRQLSVVSDAGAVGPETDALREPYLHLRAHCEAILGVSHSRTQST